MSESQSGAQSGPAAPARAARAQQVLTNSYGAAAAHLVRGQGCYVWDDQGKEYLDFLAGIAVNCLGHAHPAFVQAVSEQAATLAHVSNFFTTEPQVRLAQRLLELSGAGQDGRVFFANSGAEANEAALKLTRLHAARTGKKTVVTLKGSFHGRTMGALSLTYNPKYREPFEPLPGNVLRIEAEADALSAAIDQAVAAVFLEPIQGEVGVKPLPRELLRLVRRLTTEQGALLVVDEVQTGVGRTGDWFGYQDAQITPDIVTVAKGLGGGVPIGAAIAFGSAADLFYPGSHGTTFGGNPLAAHTANAVLDTLVTEGLLDNARRRGAELTERIAGLENPLIDGVRGRGLLLGIGLTQPVGAELVVSARKQGLIINSPRPDTIRLAPPLIVGDAEIDVFLERFAAALEDVA